MLVMNSPFPTVDSDRAGRARGEPAQRLLIHATIVAVCLWTVFFWNLSTPGLRDRSGNLKGTDFLHLYTIGTLALEHRGSDLYDMEAQAELSADRVPEAKGLRYLPLYPPQVSIFFAPFALLSYREALWFWWILSAGVYATCCYVIWRMCAGLQSYGLCVIVAAVGFPPLFHLITWGQTSALALACLTAFYLQLRAGRELSAGFVLGLLAFKPQLAFAAAIVLVGLGMWKVIFSAVASAIVEFAVGIFYYGFVPVLTWMRTLWATRHLTGLLEPRLYQTHSLRTFWSMLIPWSSFSLVLYIVSGTIVLAWTIQVWKQSQAGQLRFSILLLATVLVSPHLTVYDLVILVPAFLLLADWLLGQERTKATARMGLLLYLVYMLPLVGFLSRWTHVQMSVIAMYVLAYQIWRALDNDDKRVTAPAGDQVAQI